MIEMRSAVTVDQDLIVRARRQAAGDPFAYQLFREYLGMEGLFTYGRVDPGYLILIILR